MSSRQPVNRARWYVPTSDCSSHLLVQAERTISVTAAVNIIVVADLMSLLHYAPKLSLQAFTLIDPRTMSEIAIFRQLTLPTPCNVLVFIDLPFGST
jgi:hypothetical protein